MEKLAEFDYLGELGSGQFGTVYRCRSRLTGEERAVKHVRLPPSASITEWRREAEALAACRNDHVVPIYHAAATADGPVLVMGYQPGGDAEGRWLPGGGPVGEVVSCLIDATWGVHHLHNAGLLHRDLKPANLLFDGEGRAVIGDFGLAGVVAGTVPAAYVPHVPARVLNGQPWTRADDIYALAVTGWRLLGAPPMPGDIHRARSCGEGRHVAEPVCVAAAHPRSATPSASFRHAPGRRQAALVGRRVPGGTPCGGADRQLDHGITHRVAGRRQRKHVSPAGRDDEVRVARRDAPGPRGRVTTTDECIR